MDLFTQVSDVLDSEECSNDLHDVNVFSWDYGFGDTKNIIEITLYCNCSNTKPVEEIIHKHFHKFEQTKIIHFLNISIIDYKQERDENGLKKRLLSWESVAQFISIHIKELEKTQYQTNINDWYNFENLIDIQINEIKTNIEILSRNKIIKPFQQSAMQESNNNSWWSQLVQKFMSKRKHMENENELRVLILTNHQDGHLIKLC
jgi:hypothetical protein